MTPVSISVDEYISTMYHPDKDFVDGHLEERNMGEKEHGKLQLRMAILLQRCGMATFIETRLQLTPTRFRVPDICIYDKEPDESIFTRPPVLCVEILSPEDRMSRIMQVVQDYLTMGVLDVWILDPLAKRAYRGSAYDTFQEVFGQIRTSDNLITFTLDEIFSEKSM